MNKKHYLALLHSLWVTHKKLHILFAENTNYKEVYENIEDYVKLPIFDEVKKQEILEKKNTISAETIQEILEKNTVEIIDFWDEWYPKLLKEIANPPFLLYVQWKLDNSPKLAVVGSRKMSEYGEKVIEKMIPDLASYFSIVSGWAFGCDTKAHKSTLDAHGKTIAVIWTGIDICYPKENTQLYKKIIENGGAVISIFPLGTEGSNFTFPMRNEIIAGIAHGVLIAEAAERSGTLITAKLALEQSRDVFAIPGDMFRQNSFWCLELIKKGEAKLVTTAKDILEEYNILFESKTPQGEYNFTDSIEKDIYHSLMWESKSIDELSKHLNHPVQTIMIKLSFLELNGKISKIGNGKYQVH